MIATMRSIGTLAIATLREYLRERGLHALIVLIWIVTFAAAALGELSAGERTRVVTDIGLAATRLGGLCAALFFGAAVVAREVEQRSAATTLTAPIGRPAWLLGRFSGALLAVVVLVMLAGGVLCMVAAAVTTPAFPHVAGATSRLDVALRLLPALLLVTIELMVVAAVATMFSAFSSHLFAFGCAFGLWVAGHYAQAAAHLTANASSAPVSVLNGALWLLLPNVSSFGAATRIAQGEAVRSGEVALAAAYGVLYAAAALAIGNGLFARRDV
ncbi:MAG: ABC transporter permease subunit [Luteitalea sp.]|nr:ABC transporter permease subunit [Luteitalea sp.]